MQHAALSGNDLQRQTLRLYGELVSRHASWGGKLIFACGEGSSATGLAAAVSIAGGTSLIVDPSAATVKSVFRQGGVDFVVNTLDEAIRVLKNEIRQHRPLGVALIGELQPILTEILERGLQPDLTVSLAEPVEDLFADPKPTALTAVESSSLSRISLDGSAGIVTISDHLQHWLTHHHWTEATLEAATLSELRTLEAQTLAAIPQDDNLRRTWLQRIAHYQRPAPGSARSVWLSSAERDALHLSAPST
jgi:urocanate hydratase